MLMKTTEARVQLEHLYQLRAVALKLMHMPVAREGRLAGSLPGDRLNLNAFFVRRPLGHEGCLLGWYCHYHGGDCAAKVEMFGPYLPVVFHSFDDSFDDNSSTQHEDLARRITLIDGAICLQEEAIQEQEVVPC